MWLTTLLGAMRRLNQNPGDREGQRAFVMSLDGKALERRRTFLRSTESGRRLLAERPHLDSRQMSRASLLAMPAGTFGRALGEFFSQWNIEPFGPPPAEAKDELEWIAQRTADAHDCVHVATGYGADPLGEIEVQAFMWAQWQPLTVLVVSFFGLFCSAWRSGARETLQRYRRALARGRGAPPLDDVMWESLLDQPLASVRARLGLGVHGAR